MEKPWNIGSDGHEPPRHGGRFAVRARLSPVAMFFRGLKNVGIVQ